MSWNLYLDDERMASKERPYMLARTVAEARDFVNALGPPRFMSLDHDLGGASTTMDFLKWLVQNLGDVGAIPDYQVHSANPVGRDNIIAFMESWKKSRA